MFLTDMRCSDDLGVCILRHNKACNVLQQYAPEKQFAILFYLKPRKLMPKKEKKYAALLNLLQRYKISQMDLVIFAKFRISLIVVQSIYINLSNII